jgi:DnaJ-class molecular chaperone
MENKCEICTINIGKTIVIPKILFSPPREIPLEVCVCDECMKVKLCPRCKPKCEGKVSAKEYGTNEGGITKTCDLCNGTGQFDYNKIKK